MKVLASLVAGFLLVFYVSSCTQLPTGTEETTHQISLQKVTVFEDFEAGSKTAYAVGDVTFASGVWTLNDALVGTLASDPKNGTKSIRTRNSGKITMKFDRTDGAGVVSVLHAKYGTDASSTWSLWFSTNSGSTWTQTGTSVTTTSTTLQSASFTVNIAGTICFEIRKTDGTANRVNFDDFTINDYSASPGTTDTTTVHLTLGNPSGAVADTNFATNYLMKKAQYVLSYNRDNSEPNWTAWHLDPTWLGSTARQDDFRADVTLPSGWYQVLGTSYSGSGYDRGHMCPSADRTLTVTDNSATFLMTNMIPQSPNNNQGPWANLENYCRTLVSQGNELYIYSGGYGTQGTINNGHVNVPARTWKIIVVLAQGTNDAARVTTSTRVIAIDMPNSDALIARTADWKNYRVSVDALESILGYDFLYSVSTSVQAVIESTVDTL